MKALSALTLLLIVAAVVCGRADLSDALGFSADGGQTQDERLSSNPLAILSRLTRRPRPQHFFGLMGRRSAGETIGQKLSSFVRLLAEGRQVDPGLAEWSAAQTYDGHQ